jgi:hypothetical protein
MADTPTFNPNPYANFDPSQYTNPYSPFYGRALPWPSSYVGTPTNALGQPIQPPPGMTLNSTPQQPQAAAPAAPQVGPMTGGQYGDWRGFVGGGAGASPQANQLAYNLGLGGLGAAGDVNPGSAAGQAMMAAQSAGNQVANADKGSFGGWSPTGAMIAQPQAAPQAAAAAPPNNWQNSLAMLANPGHVTTPGATVPQAQGSTSLNPGVLQSFLGSWKPAQSGPGSGFQQNFNTILRGLQGGQKGS